MNRWVSANHAAARQGRWTAIKTWSICVGRRDPLFDYYYAHPKSRNKIKQIKNGTNPARFCGCERRTRRYREHSGKPFFFSMCTTTALKICIYRHEEPQYIRKFDDDFIDFECIVMMKKPFSFHPYGNANMTIVNYSNSNWMVFSFSKINQHRFFFLWGLFQHCP